MNHKQLDKVLSLSQIQTLCQTPTSPDLPQRHDKLLEVVLLMGYLGLRVSEAINFTWQTVSVEDKLAFLVHGKGNKDRLVFNLLNHPYLAKKAKNCPNPQWKTISRVAPSETTYKNKAFSLNSIERSLPILSAAPSPVSSNMTSV